MIVTPRSRSVQLTVTLTLDAMDHLTLANGTVVQPQSMVITYSDWRGGTAAWRMHTLKVKKDGTVGRADKEVGDTSFRSSYGPDATDVTPSWVHDLIRDHAPRHPLSEI